MSKLSKKLFLSVITLVFTVMAMVATTYAWFTIGDTATVGNVEGSVQGSEGLEIQFDGDSGDGEWYNNINTSKMSAFLGSQTDALKAISSPNGVDFYKIDEIEWDGTKVEMGTPTGAAEIDFIEFTLNFRTAAADKKVELSNLHISSLGDTTWAIDRTHDMTGTASGNDLISTAAYAVRVALVQDSTSKVYELGNKNLTTGGITNSYSTFKVEGAHDYFVQKGNTLLGVSDYDDYATDLGSRLLELYGKGYNQTKITENGEVLTEKFDIALSDTATDGYYDGSVTVRIWLEGFDADAYDAIYEGEFAVNLEFTLVNVTP